MAIMPLPEEIGRLRFDELATFVDVAECGSIAAAARRLGQPKSTVGRAIARLERDLDTPLVRRMTDGPSLTEQGRTLYALAAPHVSALRDVASAVARDVGDVYGTLRVTAPVDIANVVLGPLVAAFVARHPRVSIEVDASLRVVDLVREGVDLAVRVAARPLPSSSLVAKRLGRLHLGLYAGAAYAARRGLPRRPEDLRDHDGVLLFGREGRATLALDGPRGVTRIVMKGRISGNDFAFLREGILAGSGIGPLPWFLAQQELASGRLVRVLPDHQLAGSKVYLVHPPAKPLAKKLDVFRAHLLEHAPRLLFGG